MCAKVRTSVLPREVDLERLMMAARIRAPIDRLCDLDMASKAVLIEVRAHEEQPWMLRVQLPAERGQ
jgi:hypothetical protein